MPKFTDVYTDQAVVRKHHTIDADGKVLGRVAQEAALLLRGKGKVYFAYNRDLGDSVTIYNAAKVKITGRKLTEKIYTSYSGYPGGLRKIALGKLLAEQPEKVMQHAVKGMLPKTPPGRKLFGKLKVYKGEKAKSVS